MKQIKMFYGMKGVSLMQMQTFESMEAEVNAFLAKDGKEIKVIDVEHRFTGAIVSVMVYFEEL